MPTRFLKDDNGNDSSMRLVFIIFMVVTVTLLVIIAALMIRSHLAGAVTIYAINIPTTDIGVTLNITTKQS